MKTKHNLIAYALETTPRPGARETRVRLAPDGMHVRYGRKACE